MRRIAAMGLLAPTLLIVLGLLAPARADIYLHNMRGSNNKINVGSVAWLGRNGS